MKLVKLSRDMPRHGAYAGEVLSLQDDEADRLIARGWASTEGDTAVTQKPVDRAEESTADLQEGDVGRGLLMKEDGIEPSAPIGDKAKDDKPADEKPKVDRIGDDKVKQSSPPPARK